MSVTVTYDVDEIDLDVWLADSQTHLRLYVSNAPDGTYTYASVQVALSSTSFAYTFAYSGGTPAQWFKVVTWDGASISSLKSASAFHGGGGTTLQYLRQRIAEEMDDGIFADATGGSTTTATVVSPKFLRYVDDYFNQQIFYNATQGEWSKVTDWVNSTGTFTVLPAITSVSSGDDIEVYRRFTPDQYKNAINWSITSVYPKLNRVITSYSLRTADDQYQWAVPHDINRVLHVEAESTYNQTSSTQATRGQPWRTIPHNVIKHGLTQTIEIEDDFDTIRRLRITGLGILTQLSSDSDYVELIAPQIDIIVYMAIHYLYRLLPNGSSASDIDRYEQLSQKAWQQAQFYIDMHGTGRSPKRGWSDEVRQSGRSHLSGSHSRSNF